MPPVEIKGLFEVIGIPGSGKSFLSKSLCKVSPNRRVLVSNNRSNFEREELDFMIHPLHRGSLSSSFFRYSPVFKHRLFEIYLSWIIRMQSDIGRFASYGDAGFVLELIRTNNASIIDIARYQESFMSSLRHVTAFKSMSGDDDFSIIHDGGVLFQMSYCLEHFFCAGMVDADRCKQFIELLPYLPEKLIFIDEDPLTCFERFSTRSIGMPLVYQNLDRASVIDLLTRKRMLFLTVIGILLQRGMTVITKVPSDDIDDFV